MFNSRNLKDVLHAYGSQPVEYSGDTSFTSNCYKANRLAVLASHPGNCVHWYHLAGRGTLAGALRTGRGTFAGARAGRGTLADAGVARSGACCAGEAGVATGWIAELGAGKTSAVPRCPPVVVSEGREMIGVSVDAIPT